MPVTGPPSMPLLWRSNAHDSTAYTNLGVLALAEGRSLAARRLFAEALWLDPGSGTAREGRARSREAWPSRNGVGTAFRVSSEESQDERLVLETRPWRLPA